MRVGVAHVAGRYTWPSGSGTQFSDGCDAIWGLGLRMVKLYCTKNYLTDYPLQTSWSSVPTSLKTLAQTTQFTTQLSRAWGTVILTCFTFANGATNWWRADVNQSLLDAEYTEMRNLAEHLLSTYSGTGREFILQTWEGDWAFMDSFTVDTYVDRQIVDRYAAFLGTRIRAVRDARAAVASDCKVLCAYEANRVLDARTKPHLRRLLRDLSAKVQPDVISYSAYDSTIVDQGGWGATFDAWKAATVPAFSKALRELQLCYPGVPISIGEFGFPEGPELPPGRDVGAMIRVISDVAKSYGVKWLTYWEVFDNEEYSPGVPRGFYTHKPGGALSVAGTTLPTL